MESGNDSDSPSGQVSGSKHGKAQRNEGLQAKNREAQRRFRERQRNKVSELESKVSEQNQRISQLLQDKASLESRCSILIRVVQMRNEQLEQMPQASAGLATAVDDDLAGTFKDDLTLTVRDGTPMKLSPAQVKQMSREDLVKIWKPSGFLCSSEEYVTQLAMALLEQGRKPDNEGVTERIKRLVNEATVLSMRVAISSPLVTKSFVAFKMEDTTAAPSQENPEMWLQLARSLGLSQEQRKELAQLRQLFIVKLNVIMEQRREIHHTLMDAMPSAIGARHSAIQFLKTQENIDRLKRNMREEHVLKLDWISTLFKHMLSPTQVAKCIVQAYPYTPDTLAMCSWIAAEDGDQSALASLTSTNSGIVPPALTDAPPNQDFGSLMALGAGSSGLSGMPGDLGEVPGSMGLGTSGSGSSLASMGRAQLNNLSSSLLMPPGGSMAMHSLQTHDTTMRRSYPLSPSSGPSSSRQQDRYALPGLNAELGI
eukprot:jgi/Astpho2/9777/Aster-x1607